MQKQSTHHRGIAFALIAAIVALSTIAASVYSMWRSRTDTISQQLEKTALTARALEDHLSQSFNIVERTLRFAIDERGVVAELSPLLRHAAYLRSLALLDKADSIAASSTSGNIDTQVARTDFLPHASEPVGVLRVGALRGGRDFYNSSLVNPESPTPAISFVPVSLDIQLKSSEWRTVVAAVNPDYFLNFYSQYISPELGIVQILRYDGSLLLSTDETQKVGSINTVSKEILNRITTREAGQFEASGENGKAALIAYRASRTYPFVLVVELDKERALANWQQEAGNTFKIIGAVLLAALALAGLYFVRFERLARKQELDQEQLRIAAIAFESQEGMIITDAKAVVLRVNQAFTTITGYSAGESVGRDMNFLKSGMHSPQFYAAIRSSVESTGAFAGEILNRHKDGTIHPHFLGITAVYGDDCKVSHYVATLTDITARKSAEESLLTLSRAVEQSPVSIVITDPGGRIEYVNPRFETATGYLLSEIIGENPRIISSGEKSSTEYREMWTTLISGKTWKGEFHNRRKDGTLFWELASISPVYSDEGELIHFVAVKEDISARKQADEKIRELNRDFVAFLENTSDFIYFKDKSSRFRFCSQTMAKITGHASWRDMIGKHDREVFPEETAKIYSEEELPIFHDGVPLLGRVDPYFDEAGNPGWVSTNKWPIIGDDGTVIGIFGISRDVTAAYKMQAELEQHRHHLEALVKQRTTALLATEARASHILESSADGLYGVDCKGMVTFINPAACLLLGYRPEETIGRSAHALFHHSKPDGSPFPIHECPGHDAVLRGHETRIDNEVYWHADGHAVPVMYAIHPIIQDGESSGAVISFVDMSEQRAAAQARERALVAAENLARVRSEFLANMSHEIRTPINGVLGYAEIGYRNYQNTEKARNAFEKILVSGNRLLGVINDVLDFSKVEAGKLHLERTTVALNGVTEEVIEVVNELAMAKHLDLRLERAPNLPQTCLGDPLRIGQILLNLLSNAVKFTETGSVTLAASIADEHLIFRVTDTGIGMSEELIRRLFVPFEQGDGSMTRRFGGTGLGLTIAKRIAELMEGDIRVESQPGNGSTFEFRLPYHPSIEVLASAISLTAPPANATDKRLMGLTILIAEDEPVNQEILELNLTDEGARVVMVSNGQQAVERVLQDGRTNYDIVLMDMQMPVLDGLKATQRILEFAPDLPIIGQTANAFAEDQAQCFEAGMAGYITKPIDHNALVTLILKHVSIRREE